MLLYIVDKNNKTLCALSSDFDSRNTLNFYNDTWSQFLKTPSTFSFDCYGGHKNSEHVAVGNQVIFKFEDEYHLFLITEIEQKHEGTNEMSVYCEHTSLSLLNSVVLPSKNDDINLEQALRIVLADTDFQVGNVDFLGFKTLEISGYDTVLSEIEKLAEEYKAELKFRVEFNPAKGITGKYVDAFESVGENKGVRFVVGHNVQDVVKKVDFGTVCTAIIPHNGDAGCGSAECTVAKNGFDKPQGQIYVAVPEEERMAILGDRTNKHVFGVIDCETDDPYTMCQLAWEHLQKVKEPAVEYTFNPALLNRSVHIGDTVKCIDREMDLQLEAKVSELNISFTDSTQDSITLTNYEEVESNISDEIKKLQNKLENIDIESNVIVDSFPPTNPNDQTVWVDITDTLQNVNGIISIKTWDEEKKQWVSSIDKETLEQYPTKNEVTNEIGVSHDTLATYIDNELVNREMTVYKQDTTPDRGINGQLWLNTSVNPNVWYKYNGTTNQWELLIVAGIDTDTKNKVDAIEQVQNETTEIVNDANAKVNELYANVETIESDLTQAKNDILDKASKGELTAVDNRLTNTEIQVTQNTNDISTKVSNTTYELDKNALTERIATAESNITQNANEISTKVTQAEIDNAINNLQVGGRNLLENTNSSKNDYVKLIGQSAKISSVTDYQNTNGTQRFNLTSDGSTEIYYRFVNSSTMEMNGFEKGETYTFSGKIKISTTSGTLKHVQARTEYYKSGAWYELVNDFITTSDLSDWEYFSETFYIPLDATSVYVSFQIYFEGTSYNGTMETKELKLEKGTKATDYTPAIEDTDNEISTLNGKVTTNTSNITQLSNEIQTKVTSSQVENIVNTAIESLSGDGRNMVLYGDCSGNSVPRLEEDDSYNLSSNVSAELYDGRLWIRVTPSSGYETYHLGKQTTLNGFLMDTYTFAFDIKIQSDSDLTLVDIQAGFDEYDGTTWHAYHPRLGTLTPISINGDWRRYALTFTFNQEDAIIRVPLIRVPVSSSLTNPYFLLDNIKVEKGTEATVFTKNPNELTSAELSALKQRITTAESTLTQHSNQIALKVDQTEYETDMNGVTTRLSDAESQLVVQGNQIATKVTQTEVDNAINNLKIGGTNILWNTNFDESLFNINNGEYWYSADKTLNYIEVLEKEYLGKNVVHVNNNTTDNDFDFLQQTLYHIRVEKRYIENEQYTFSFYVKGSGTVATYIYPGVGDNSQDRIVDGVVNGKAQGDNFWTWELTNEWTRHTYTFTITDTQGSNRTFTNVLFRLRANSEIYIAMPQLEKGNKATDYKESIDDANRNISSLGTRMSSAESSIQQNANQIALKVNTTDYETDKNGITTRLENAEGQLVVQAGQIATKVTQTEINNAIDNLQIGGVNLASKDNIIYSQDSTTLTESNYVYTIFSNNKYGGMMVKHNIFEDGKDYVLSFKFQKKDGTLKNIGGHSGSFGIGTAVLDDSISYSYSSPIVITDDNEVHEIKVQLKNFGGNTTTSDKRLYIQPNRLLEDSITVDIWDIQIEKGDKATDWKIPQADVTSNIDNLDTRISTAESSIQQNANQIALKVNQETYNTDVSGLTNRITSAEGQLVVQAGQIASKVNQTTYDIDMSSLTTRMNSAESDIIQNANNIALKVNQTDFNALGSRVSSNETKIQANTNNIALKVNQTEFDNMIIGGQNLLIGSKTFNKGDTVDSTFKKVYRHNDSDDYIIENYKGDFSCIEATQWKGFVVYLDPFLKDGTFKVGDKITMSFNVDNNTTVTANIWYYNMQLDSDGVTRVYELSDNSHSIKDVSASSSIRLSTTITIEQAMFDLVERGGNCRFTIQNTSENQSDGTKVLLYAPKLELGNKGSEWSDNNEKEIIELTTRINNAEIKIEDDAIISTVTSSETFLSALDDKVGHEDVVDFATRADVDNTIENIDIQGTIDRRINDLIDDPQSNLNLVYTTQAQLEQTATDINARFSMANGLNLIKNSAFMGGSDNWSIKNGGSIMRDESLKKYGFENYLHTELAGYNVWHGQYYIPVNVGSTYTLSFYAKKIGDNQAVLKVQTSTEDNFVFQGEYRWQSEDYTEDWERFQFTFTATYQFVELVIGVYDGVSFDLTGLMLHEGTIPLAWGLASGEVYNTNVRMNINGIQVQQIDAENIVTGYTAITPDEFAGYNKNGSTFEKVFWINEDETTTKKLRATNEITMGTIKIVNVNNDSYSGWAFTTNIDD